MTSWRAAGMLLIAGVFLNASHHEAQYFGTTSGVAGGIVTIDQRGLNTAAISVNGVFSGFTPATLKLPPGDSEIVAEYGETRYVFRMAPARSGAVLRGARAEVPSPERHCFPLNENDRRGAVSWARSLDQKNRELTWLQVPGPVRGGGCPLSPWFGTDEYRDVRITSTPSGAVVIYERQRLGVTPLASRIKIDSGTNRFSAHKNGYLTAVAAVRTDAIFEGASLNFALRAAQ